MIADNREDGGRKVREAWVRWATETGNSNPHHLLPWEALGEEGKEADRRIWEEIVSPYIEESDNLRKQNAGLLRYIDELRQDLEDYEESLGRYAE